MAPVKLLVGYKCRLFGSSRNLLGLGEYSIDHSEERSIESTPLGTPTECENNVVAAKPSAMHVIVISTNNDGHAMALPICIEGKSSICALSTTLKKKKTNSGRYSQCESNRQFQDMWATKLP